jgi:hypothetical protein
MRLSIGISLWKTFQKLSRQPDQAGMVHKEQQFMCPESANPAEAGFAGVRRTIDA